MPAAGLGDMIVATVKKGKPELRKKGDHSLIIIKYVKMLFICLFYKLDNRSGNFKNFPHLLIIFGSQMIYIKSRQFVCAISDFS